MRRLIVIPMVHTEAEIGYDFLSEEEKKNTELLWKQIREAIGNLDLDWKSVKLFVDGIVNAQDELEILRSSGPTAETIRMLVERRGTSIMPTEDADLCSKTSELVREAFSQSSKTKRVDLQGEKGFKVWDSALSMLKEVQENTILRDKAIAHNIDTGLRNDETGILFIGSAHNVQEHLPRDIQAEPISEDVFALRELLGDHTMIEKDIEEVRAIRDSFAPPSRGPERQ